MIIVFGFRTFGVSRLHQFRFERCFLEFLDERRRFFALPDGALTLTGGPWAFLGI